jgi:hypothetical protein
MPTTRRIGTQHEKNCRIMYNWIKKYQEHHFTTPSRREIADWFETSTSVVNYDLACMEQLGWVRVIPRQARSIVLMPITKEM